MRFVIYGFLFLGAIHLANLFYGPIIKNHMLEGKMIQLSQESRLKDDRYLVKDLVSFIEDNGIELDTNEIKVYHPEPKKVIISAQYEIFRKFWFMEKSFVFEPSSDNAGHHGIIPDFAAY